MNTNDYFQSYYNYFWQWEDNAEVIAIPNSYTITYKDLLLSIIKELKSQGLPPFGALLLSVTAINPKGKETLSTIYSVLEGYPELVDKDFIGEVVNFLSKLADVPEKYKTGNKKILLLKTIFENCHNIISLESSKKIYEEYSKDFQKYQYQAKVEHNQSSINKDLRTIYLLNNKFNSSDDIIKRISDIPEIEEELILEKQLVVDEPDFIEQLIDNDKTFQVGALVKMIWSGIKIPFHSYVSSQQPIGGVSDLSNKGDLSQLLISEFANEDEVFLSRLANNEALYLNRESPPSTNDMKRVVLIDVSLKNWGTPKTVAYAILLAIAKHPKTDIECEAFALGTSCVPVKFDSVDDIIEALQIVEPVLDLTNGLEEYFKNMTSVNNEILIITEKTTQNQTNMAKAMNDFGDKINYWIFNDSNGVIDIYKKLQRSRKHIQHLEIPLERLWEHKRKSKKRESVKREFDYYPVLVPDSQNLYGIRPTENGEIFLLNKEKTLLRFHNKDNSISQSGWEVFYENIPINYFDFEIGVLKNGEYLILLYNQHDKEVKVLNLTTGDENVTKFTQWKWRNGNDFVFFEQKFHHYNGNGCWSINQYGKIEEESIESNKLFEIFRKRVEKIVDISNKYKSNSSILKNIDSVGITSEGNLQFNKHVLVINPGYHIKLKQQKSRNIQIEAKVVGNNIFEFEDGSQVIIDKSGIIILRSSDESIPEIYIPSVLNMGLGVATLNDFAGNGYFKNNPVYELTLEETGAQKISVIKLIREQTLAGLKDMKEFVESTPAKVALFMNKEKADQLKEELENAGAKVSISKLNEKHKTLNEISTSSFFSEYIYKFTKTIRDYEAYN